ncbi:MAG: hypothetical protein Q8R72_07545 [Hylemonella sp.]|nr:hypothetical protein [Hylemonella sp.]
MFSNWAYILVGDNNTGKTSFQRYLIQALCGKEYGRLPRNVVNDITHPRAPKKLETLFTVNRSYQETASEYRSVPNYFAKFFEDADICILSSHSHGTAIDEIRQMHEHLISNAYNVAGVFWSNDFGVESQRISKEIPWQERLWVDNPRLKNAERVPSQLRRLAYEFAEILVERARFQ